MKSIFMIKKIILQNDYTIEVIIAATVIVTTLKIYQIITVKS